MQVLAVASEMYPLVKTGGLADVVGALPGALASLGIEVRTLLPGYPAVLGALTKLRTVHRFDALMGGEALLRAGQTAQGARLLVLDAPHLYARPGGPYAGPDGDFADNPQRFAALALAGAAVARGALEHWRPDVIHAHDWQAGLLPAYLHFHAGEPVPSLFTVHNLAFHGWAEPSLLGVLDLPGDSFTVEGVEFYGGIGFLKAGLRLADRISTVSPTYAAEILRPENGQGLDGLLRRRAADLSGIVNGIDTEVWAPAHDPLIPRPFHGVHARQRGHNRAALQAAFGLDPSEAPLFAVVSRLTHQKGIDLLLACLPVLEEGGAQLAVLGTGEPGLEQALRDAASAAPGRVGVLIGYDEALAHLMQAGCDALIVPSRFEPCGLTQLCALRYGAVPVVARVGGLNDTVVDANPAALAAGVATGVQFFPVDADGLALALRRTLALWADREAWGRVQRNAIKAPVGWDRAAPEYAAIFRALAGNRAGGTHVGGA